MTFEVFCCLSLSAAAIVYFLNILEHKKRMNKFYDTIDEMITNYYNIYPNEDPFYFSDLVEPESVTMWKPWVNDYNEFIINPEKLKELFEGNKKFLKSEENSVKVFCPWCGNIEPEKFLFAPYEENKPKGIMLCIECKSTSPPGNLKDGMFIFDKNEKLEKNNEKI